MVFFHLPLTAANVLMHVCVCSDQPNCRVQIKMVDGDHRVAIYAAQDIPTGTELLYNYGNRFGKV